MQPVASFAMSPTTGNKNLVEKAIRENLGPFYGKQQADEWKKELHRKEYDRQYGLKAYDPEKYPDLYTVNGALYLSSKKSILQHKSLFSSTSLGYIMSERDSIDIDTELDWEIAEFLMKKIL